MSTSPHLSRLRSLYRRLLRELPARAARQTILSHPSPIQQRIRSSFASTPTTTSSTSSSQPAPTSQTTKPPTPPPELGNPEDDARVRSALAEAEQFALYAAAQRSYATLVERYNPGMGMAEEDRVRLTARRVGMELPVEVNLRRRGERDG